MQSEPLDDLLSATSSWVTMCERFYRDPPTRPTVLDDAQRKVFYTLQFGDDIRDIPAKYIRPHTHVIVCAPRQVAGKTYTVSKLAATIAPIYDGFHIGCYGPGEKRAMKLLRLIKDNLKYSDFNHLVRWRLRSKEHLELENETTVECFNTSEGNIRGDTEHVQMIDECDFILNDDLILDAIEPKTLLPRSQGWGKILAISTPNLAREESLFKTWYYSAVEHRKLFCKNCYKIAPISAYVTSTLKEDDFGIFEVPAAVGNCSCGAHNFVYYSDSDEILVPFNPMKSVRVPWADIKARLDARGWTPRARAEYLGEMCRNAGGMFPLKVLTGAEALDLHNYLHPPPNWHDLEHETCCGLDFGKTHDNSVLTIVECKNQMYNLVNMTTIESEQMQDPTWEQIRKFFMPVIMEWEPTFLVIDGTSLGESGEIIKREIEASPLDTLFLSNKPKEAGFWIDRKTKVELVSNLEEKMHKGAFKNPALHEPQMRELRVEFLNFGFEVSKSQNLIYKALKGKDDRVMSIALALIGFNQEIFPDMLKYAKGFGSNDNYTLQHAVQPGNAWDGWDRVPEAGGWRS